MPHYADPEFWRLYRALPKETSALADKCFELLKASPAHPSLHFKKIKGREVLWSARVGRDTVPWLWRSMTAYNGFGLELMPTMIA